MNVISGLGGENMFLLLRLLIIRAAFYWLWSEVRSASFDVV